MAIYLGTNKVDGGGLKPGNQLGFMSNGKLIAEKTFSFPLSDTNYSSLTISTSSQTLTLPATTYTTSPSTSITVYRLGESYDGTVIDRAEKNYSMLGTGLVTYAYTQSSSVMDGLVHGVKTSICGDYQPYKYHPVASNGELSTSFSYSSGYTFQTVLLSKKTDGTYQLTSSSYGISSSSSPRISVTSNSYLDLTLANIIARASTTYFPVEAMDYLDPENTILTFTWYVYEGDMNTTSYIYQTAYNNAALQ